MPKQSLRYSGWLNLIKPKGISSANLVGKVKALLDSSFGKNSHKVGHAGTLDPLASGVLPIAIGKATKLMEYLSVDYKEYEFTVKFGQRTDTGDLEGKIVEESPHMPLLQDLESNVASFYGKRFQVPPVFSAIKVNGQRSYDLARANKSVALAPRLIEIRELDLLSYEQGLASYRTKCSSGTYIRSLAEDIAKSLGTCGVVHSLTRISSGDFAIKHAFDLFETNYENRLAELLKRLLPLDFILSSMEKVVLNKEQSLKLQQGVKISLTGWGAPGLRSAYCEDLLIAVGILGLDGMFESRKVLVEQASP